MIEHGKCIFSIERRIRLNGGSEIYSLITEPDGDCEQTLNVVSKVVEDKNGHINLEFTAFLNLEETPGSYVVVHDFNCSRDPGNILSWLRSKTRKDQLRLLCERRHIKRLESVIASITKQFPALLSELQKEVRDFKKIRARVDFEKNALQDDLRY